MSRRLLYLDTHRLSAWRWTNGQVIAEAVFENSDEDLTRFADYLHQNTRNPFTLLANSPEEGYQQETIPFVRGSDRAALIGRRLGQYFFNTPLTTAIPLGFEKDKRRNEKLLLSALTNLTQFEPWLGPLGHAEIALTGLYSLAQLGGALLSKLDHPPTRCLLLTAQDSSIRESFIVDGVTIFSRVAPLPDSSLAETATAFAAEARKLQQYLLGQRLVGRNETLSAFVLAHPLARQAVRASCIDSGNLRFEILDNHLAARRIGLKNSPDDSRSETLFIHLLACQAPRQQYFSEDFRHDYRILLLKRTLLGLSFASLAVALLMAAFQLLSGLQLRNEATDYDRMEADAQRRYRAVAATFPQVQISTDALRQVIGRYAELQQQQGGPSRFYQSLSQALNPSPAIEIDSIEWKKSSADSKTGNEENATLIGNVRLAQKAPPRQTIATFENFVQTLGKQNGLSVSVIRSPFDIEPGQALKGSNRETEWLQQHPFTLRISRKVQP